jgi:hypothetical protein
MIKEDEKNEFIFHLIRQQSRLPTSNDSSWNFGGYGSIVKVFLPRLFSFVNVDLDSFLPLKPVIWEV